MALSSVRAFLSTYAPRSLIYGVPAAVRKPRERRIRRLFDRAPSTPEFLAPEVLPELHADHHPPGAYGYDDDAVAARSALRVRRLLWLLGDRARHLNHFLELGAHDAMTSRTLRLLGKDTTAVDVTADFLDARARAAGVRFEKADAARLPQADDTFDCVFSYNAFEHFPQPDRALREAIRVVRPGGVVYLDFGPLYHSPWGLHEYQAINLPYCQVLFEKDVLARFVQDHELGWVDFDAVNQWGLSAYRRLWTEVAERVEVPLIKTAYFMLIGMF